jgi:hypothetical protein
MGWQALQVTDFKDPHHPAVCLIRYQFTRK